MINKVYKVEKDDYLNAGKVSSSIKQLISSIGLSNEVIRRIAVASYEAEINMIIHSYGGEIIVSLNDENISLVFKDVGPGIEDINMAMTPGYSTANENAQALGFGAGMGLVNIKRVSDEFDLISDKNGTTLTLKFRMV